MLSYRDRERPFEAETTTGPHGRPVYLRQRAIPDDGSAIVPPTMTTHDLQLEWPDGRVETIAAGADETVLDAAEAADIGLPFGCLTGACATCTARLLEGDLEHRRPPRALKERHLDEGYVLLCIAEPRADSRLRVGADVQAELVENPWR